MNDFKLITIPLLQFKLMEKDVAKLDALENYGVDSWSGYGEAMASLDRQTKIIESNKDNRIKQIISHYRRIG